MKFCINNREWTIEEVNSNWLLTEYRKENDNGVYCFGLTRYNEQVIYINTEVHRDVKKQTLYHELMHCYLWNYAQNFNEVSEELLCDISANSHDIIHKIAETYFKYFELKESDKNGVSNI